MVAVVSIRMFDLAYAPPDLQGESALLPLRPDSPDADRVIVHMLVGDYDTLPNGEHETNGDRVVTFAEYRLHKWFEELGAGRGEAVLLTWGAPEPLAAN